MKKDSYKSKQNSEMEYKIQSLVFPTESRHLQCRDLFFHGAGGYLNRGKRSLSLVLEQNVDFVTYINACSLKKWKTYTNAKGAVLYLELQGDFHVCYLGYKKDVTSVERTDMKQGNSIGKKGVQFAMNFRITGTV